MVGQLESTNDSKLRLHGPALKASTGRAPWCMRSHCTIGLCGLPKETPAHICAKPCSEWSCIQVALQAPCIAQWASVGLSWASFVTFPVGKRCFYGWGTWADCTVSMLITQMTCKQCSGH